MNFTKMDVIIHYFVKKNEINFNTFHFKKSLILKFYVMIAEYSIMAFKVYLICSCTIFNI
jgi:hypothetical protein